MRIALNCQTLVPPFTGVQQCILGMLRSLPAAGPDDEFLAYLPRNLDRAQLPQHPNLEYRRTLIGAGNRTLRIFWEQFVLWRRAELDQVDVLLAPCYIMPLWSRVPTVAFVHDALAFTNPKLCTASNRSHFRRLLPETARRAARLVTPAHAVKRDLLDVFSGLKPGKVEVAPWGVDEIFRPVTDEKILRETALRHGLPPKFVLHVGRNEPKKNLKQLIEAFFSAVVPGRLPHRLVLVGPKGWGSPQLAKVAKELGIADRVLCLGYVPREELPALYSLADAFAFPSLAEGFGIPALEAMACGCPVLASNVRHLKEVCGEAALFCEAGSLASLREGLEKILGEETLRARLRRLGLERAAGFTWEKWAERTLLICRECAKIKDEG